MRHIHPDSRAAQQLRHAAPQTRLEPQTAAIPIGTAATSPAATGRRGRQRPLQPARRRLRLLVLLLSGALAVVVVVLLAAAIFSASSSPSSSRATVGTPSPQPSSPPSQKPQPHQQQQDAKEQTTRESTSTRQQPTQPDGGYTTSTTSTAPPVKQPTATTATPSSSSSASPTVPSQAPTLTGQQDDDDETRAATASNSGNTASTAPIASKPPQEVTETTAQANSKQDVSNDGGHLRESRSPIAEEMTAEKVFPAGFVSVSLHRSRRRRSTGGTGSSASFSFSVVAPHLLNSPEDEWGGNTNPDGRRGQKDGPAAAAEETADTVADNHEGIPDNKPYTRPPTSERAKRRRGQRAQRQRGEEETLAATTAEDGGNDGAEGAGGGGASAFYASSAERRRRNDLMRRVYTSGKVVAPVAANGGDDGDVVERDASAGDSSTSVIAPSFRRTLDHFFDVFRRFEFVPESIRPIVSGEGAKNSEEENAASSSVSASYSPPEQHRNYRYRWVRLAAPVSRLQVQFFNVRRDKHHWQTESPSGSAPALSRMQSEATEIAQLGREGCPHHRNRLSSVMEFSAPLYPRARNDAEADAAETEGESDDWSLYFPLEIYKELYDFSSGERYNSFSMDPRHRLPLAAYTARTSSKGNASNSKTTAASQTLLLVPQSPKKLDTSKNDNGGEVKSDVFAQLGVSSLCTQFSAAEGAGEDDTKNVRNTKTPCEWSSVTLLQAAPSQNANTKSSKNHLVLAEMNIFHTSSVLLAKRSAPHTVDGAPAEAEEDKNEGNVLPDSPRLRHRYMEKVPKRAHDRDRDGTSDSHYFFYEEVQPPSEDELRRGAWPPADKKRNTGADHETSQLPEGSDKNEQEERLFNHFFTHYTISPRSFASVIDLPAVTKLYGFSPHYGRHRERRNTDSSHTRSAESSHSFDTQDDGSNVIFSADAQYADDDHDDNLFSYTGYVRGHGDWADFVYNTRQQTAADGEKPSGSPASFAAVSLEGGNALDQALPGVVPLLYVEAAGRVFGFLWVTGGPFHFTVDRRIVKNGSSGCSQATDTQDKGAGETPEMPLRQRRCDLVVSFFSSAGETRVLFFPGPTAADVLRQYYSVVGFPAAPPLRSLGLHVGLKDDVRLLRLYDAPVTAEASETGTTTSAASSAVRQRGTSASVPDTVATTGNVLLSLSEMFRASGVPLDTVGVSSTSFISKGTPFLFPSNPAGYFAAQANANTNANAAAADHAQRQHENQRTWRRRQRTLSPFEVQLHLHERGRRGLSIPVLPTVGITGSSPLYLEGRRNGFFVSEDDDGAGGHYINYFYKAQLETLLSAARVAAGTENSSSKKEGDRRAGGEEEGEEPADTANKTTLKTFHETKRRRKAAAVAAVRREQRWRMPSHTVDFTSPAARRWYASFAKYARFQHSTNYLHVIPLNSACMEKNMITTDNYWYSHRQVAPATSVWGNAMDAHGEKSGRSASAREKNSRAASSLPPPLPDLFGTHNVLPPHLGLRGGRSVYEAANTLGLLYSASVALGASKRSQYFRRGLSFTHHYFAGVHRMGGGSAVMTTSVYRPGAVRLGVTSDGGHASWRSFWGRQGEDENGFQFIFPPHELAMNVTASSATATAAGAAQGSESAFFSPLLHSLLRRVTAEKLRAGWALMRDSYRQALSLQTLGISNVGINAGVVSTILDDLTWLVDRTSSSSSSGGADSSQRHSTVEALYRFLSTERATAGGASLTLLEELQELFDAMLRLSSLMPAMRVDYFHFAAVAPHSQEVSASSSPQTLYSLLFLAGLEESRWEAAESAASGSVPSTEQQQQQQKNHQQQQLTQLARRHALPTRETVILRYSLLAYYYTNLFYSAEYGQPFLFPVRNSGATAVSAGRAPQQSSTHCVFLGTQGYLLSCPQLAAGESAVAPLSVATALKYSDTLAARRLAPPAITAAATHHHHRHHHRADAATPLSHLQFLQANVPISSWRPPSLAAATSANTSGSVSWALEPLEELYRHHTSYSVDASASSSPSLQRPARMFQLPSTILFTRNVAGHTADSTESPAHYTMHVALPNLKGLEEAAAAAAAAARRNTHEADDGGVLLAEGTLYYDDGSKNTDVTPPKDFYTRRKTKGPGAAGAAAHPLGMKPRGSSGKSRALINDMTPEYCVLTVRLYYYDYEGNDADKDSVDGGINSSDSSSMQSRGKGRRRRRRLLLRGHRRGSPTAANSTNLDDDGCARALQHIVSQQFDSHFFQGGSEYEELLAEAAEETEAARRFEGDNIRRVEDDTRGNRGDNTDRRDAETAAGAGAGVPPPPPPLSDTQKKKEALRHQYKRKLEKSSEEASGRKNGGGGGGDTALDLLGARKARQARGREFGACPYLSLHNISSVFPVSQFMGHLADAFGTSADESDANDGNDRPKDAKAVAASLERARRRRRNRALLVRSWLPTLHRIRFSFENTDDMKLLFSNSFSRSANRVPSSRHPLPSIDTVVKTEGNSENERNTQPHAVAADGHRNPSGITTRAHISFPHSATEAPSNVPDFVDVNFLGSPHLSSSFSFGDAGHSSNATTTNRHAARAFMNAVVSDGDFGSGPLLFGEVDATMSSSIRLTGNVWSVELPL